MDLKNYVQHAIGAILMYELQIAKLKEFAFFPEVDRARLTKQGAIEAIYPLHATAFTRCISEKRKGHILGFKPVRKNFRMVSRIMTYLTEHSLPFDVPSVREAFGDLQWPGKKAAPMLTWLGNVVSSAKMVEFAQKTEISSFVPGGLDTLFEKEDETKKAPFPPCFIYTAIEDSLQHAHLEVQMKAAAVKSFEVGCRLGNLEKAVGVRVIDLQPNMQYPPKKIPLDSLEARNYSLPIAEIQLPRVKTSLHDGAGHSFSIPLVDSRRRSQTVAFSHVAERVESMRAEGLTGIALKCQNQTGLLAMQLSGTRSLSRTGRRTNGRKHWRVCMPSWKRRQWSPGRSLRRWTSFDFTVLLLSKHSIASFCYPSISGLAICRQSIPLRPLLDTLRDVATQQCSIRRVSMF